MLHPRVVCGGCNCLRRKRFRQRGLPLEGVFLLQRIMRPDETFPPRMGKSP